MKITTQIVKHTTVKCFSFKEKLEVVKKLLDKKYLVSDIVDFRNDICEVMARKIVEKKEEEEIK